MLQSSFLAAHWLDITTTVLGLAYILLEYRVSIWMWAVGAVMQLLGIVLYYQKGLYADCGMEFCYLAMTAYGWWRWQKKALPQRGNRLLGAERLGSASDGGQGGEGALGEGTLSSYIHRSLRHCHAGTVCFRVEDFLPTVCTRHVGEVAAAPRCELAVHDAREVSRDSPGHLTRRCYNNLVLPKTKAKG